VVEVVAGTAPYSVRLATTRTPAGEDEAVLQPGETVVLRTDDVAWGETIDGRLEYAARDGSGIAYTDELDEYSFTRPTREDCEAVAAPTTPHPVPTTPTSAPSSTTAPRSTPGGTAGGAPAPSTTAPSTTAPTTAPTTSSPAGGAPMDGPDGDDAQEVTAGDTVTLQASGFLPGERVTIQLHGSDDELGSAIAGPDGTVRTKVRIPDRTAAGPATVDLVGDRSAVVADVPLQVVGSETVVLPGDRDGVGDLVPLTAAAVALVATVRALVSVAGSRRSPGRGSHIARRA
jgi:hypothetical protein